VNGKGDKYRVKWSKNYENNYNKIFRENDMLLIDSRGRSLELGKRVRIEEDIPSPEGMLYKHTLVKLDEFNTKTKKIRVTDSTGKVWWINPTQVSASFL
tara:strand:+ start:293 stop:589 length:297 start_codon:yes stop_codon:yes gene_type:complete